MSTEHLTLSSLEGELPSSNAQDALLPPIDSKKLAWQDIKEGIQKRQIWFMLAYQDIKARYRRSVLGPLWLTLSMAITVYSMGYLYSQLFNVELQHYYPFLVAGMLGWSLILTLVIDYTDGFLHAHALIKQIKLPYSLYIHRIAARNLFIFGHNVLVMIPIYIYFHNDVPINGYTLLLIPALVVLYLNAFLYGTIIAMVSARYRDVSQIIKSLMQVIFFLTPVMWQPQGLLGKKHIFVELNPFYAFLELIRAPLLGKLPTLNNLTVILGVTLLGVLLYSKVFTRFRSRIIYWL